MNIVLHVEDFPRSDKSRVTLTRIEPDKTPISHTVQRQDALNTARTLLEQAFTFERREPEDDYQGA